MHCGRGQQSRDGNIFGIHSAVRQHQNIIAVVHRLFCLGAKVLQCGFHARSSSVCRETNAQSFGFESTRSTRLDPANFLQILVAQYRLVNFQAFMRPTLIQTQQIRSRTNVRDQRHDQLFADGVNGRVGDLGKTLLEIVVQQAWTVG